MVVLLRCGAYSCTPYPITSASRWAITIIMLDAGCHTPVPPATLPPTVSTHHPPAHARPQVSQACLSRTRALWVSTYHRHYGAAWNTDKDTTAGAMLRCVAVWQAARVRKRQGGRVWGGGEDGGAGAWALGPGNVARCAAVTYPGLMSRRMVTD